MLFSLLWFSVALVRTISGSLELKFSLTVLSPSAGLSCGRRSSFTQEHSRAESSSGRASAPVMFPNFLMLVKSRFIVVGRP